MLIKLILAGANISLRREAKKICRGGNGAGNGYGNGSGISLNHPRNQNGSGSSYNAGCGFGKGLGLGCGNLPSRLAVVAYLGIHGNGRGDGWETYYAEYDPIFYIETNPDDNS